jgi:hypothetical protein
VEETIGYEALFSSEEWDALEDWEPDPNQPHKITVYKGNDDRYEVDCDACGHISAEDSPFEAEKLAVLHEILRARPVESKSVER